MYSLYKVFPAYLERFLISQDRNPLDAHFLHIYVKILYGFGNIIIHCTFKLPFQCWKQ